ncbi:efflux transporter outer membrane subunit [Sphingopyxis sp.]|uniref:efflux transporter outer membrane subunit n=1 Tax=Sphingopyxis sp. TaxID=1908224 RepID=UPI002EDB1E9D
MRARVVRLAVIAASALLGACSMAPAYRPPQTIAPQDYKEVAGWTQATPLDTAARTAWWEAFNDPILNDLEIRAEKASPTLAAALARYDGALAAARVERADLFPTVVAGGDASRQRLSGGRFGGDGNARTYKDFSVSGALDYEIDLWGRIRNGVASARADAEASEADLASARLSLQAAVADAYVRLRGLDAQADLLRQTVEAFEKAYDLTVRRHNGGIASGIDVNRARTVLGNARAQISAVAAERAATEHEIAALVGELASNFSIPPAVQPLDAPALPAGTPSHMLQRRPDIAAAERRMAAANARIGVARAAFFPTLTLGGAAGFETTHGQLLQTPNSFWGLGPLAAVLTLFDGGRRTSQVKMSRAEYEELAAGYRDTVLSAFRQAEDAIATNRLLAVQTGDQRSAAEAAARTSSLALTRYRNGAADYLEVVTAQTDALEAQRATLALETQRMRGSVALVKAIGGS